MRPIVQVLILTPNTDPDLGPDPDPVLHLVLGGGGVPAVIALLKSQLRPLTTLARGEEARRPLFVLPGFYLQLCVRDYHCTPKPPALCVHP